MSEEFLYIDTPTALIEFSDSLRGSPWLCVDTEFMREKTYYPQLCLIQVANDKSIACIDPLTIDDLTPLLDVLYDPSITKVFHAAKQDLEILYHLRGSVPVPLFDTQVAAALLFHNDQIGYAKLVEQLLGIRLDKAHTRTDWSLRPLDAGQLRYAADDVRYLRDVYRKQLDELQRQGRLAWLDEDFKHLSDASLYAPQPEQTWQRVKETRRLKGVQLAVLRALSAWRERRAMDADKPRRWILRDEILAELSRAMPDDLSALARIRGVEDNTVKRRGDELLQVIAQARNTPPEDWPAFESRTILTPEQDALVDLMMAVVRMRAREHGLGAAMLATRHDLERLAQGNQDTPALHGWRRALIGNDLQALVDGQRWLGVEQGVPTMRST